MYEIKSNSFNIRGYQLLNSPAAFLNFTLSSHYILLSHLLTYYFKLENEAQLLKLKYSGLAGQFSF